MEEAGVDELAGQCYSLSTLPQILFGHCYITITDFIRIHGQSLGGWVAAVFFPAVHHCVYVMLQSQSSFGLIVVCGCDCDWRFSIGFSFRASQFSFAFFRSPELAVWLESEIVAAARIACIE